MSTQICTSFMVQQTFTRSTVMEQGTVSKQTTTKPWDGTPAHFSHVAREYLDVAYPNQRMGRAGPVASPPRSPDINPLDFYLWGRLKTLVYATEIPNVAALQQRIENGCTTVRNEVNGVCSTTTGTVLCYPAWTSLWTCCTVNALNWCFLCYSYVVA